MKNHRILIGASADSHRLQGRDSAAQVEIVGFHTFPNDLDRFAVTDLDAVDNRMVDFAQHLGPKPLARPAKRCKKKHPRDDDVSEHGDISFAERIRPIHEYGPTVGIIGLKRDRRKTAPRHTARKPSFLR